MTEALDCQKQSPEMFFKIGVLENFAIFRLATLLKIDSNTGVFL